VDERQKKLVIRVVLGVLLAATLISLGIQMWEYSTTKDVKTPAAFYVMIVSALAYALVQRYFGVDSKKRRGGGGVQK